MSLPEIAGHELLDLIGGGSSGAVYRASAGGRACAVKVFSAMAINRRALAATIRSLHHMPAHAGVLPVHGYSFDQSPYFAAMPLVGMMTKDEQGRKAWQTPTLETVCGRVSGEQAWGYIYEVADALAWLHKHGIAHGNLRPANILIEDDPGSSIRLTDIGQGWVGGTHHFELGDHWVHLCPDHVEDPEGAHAGQGHSWDVYSFGVLAFRLLTGRFPRGERQWRAELEEMDRKAASGLPHRINGEALLTAIREEPTVSWPDEAASKWDQRRREIIERALALDPAVRWRDMREVVREFEVLESDYLLEDARARIEVEKSKQAGRVRSLQLACGGLLAGLSLATILFALTFFRARRAETTITTIEERHAGEIAQREQRIAGLTTERDTALAARAQADTNLQHSQNAVDQFLTQLLQTPTGNTMEVEFSRKQLEEALAFVQSNLEGLEKSPQLGPERARAYGNIGLIHLRLHQQEQAASYLDNARNQAAQLLEENTGSPHAALYHQWLGRYSLLLSGIRSEQGKGEDSLKLLKDATSHLQTGLDGDAKNRLARYECARAWLEYGTRSRKNGDNAESLAALGKVPAVLDAKLIGGELLGEEKFTVARGKFERALAERDAGKVEEALATLIESAQEMGQLVMGSSPRNQDQALALAEAYTEMAEVIGTHFGSAEAIQAHEQAIPILLELNRLHPDWAEVKFLLACNYGAMASLDRDTGKPSEAIKKKQDAIEWVNEVLADNKDNTRYVFLLAKLRGEYAELLADIGKAKDAVPIVKQAVASLETLVGTDPAAKLTPERKRWEMQLAQLYGVLGHTCENSNQKTLAKSSFTTAAARWEKLAAADAANEAIQQGLAWTKNRLAKLK